MSSFPSRPPKKPPPPPDLSPDTPNGQINHDANNGHDDSANDDGATQTFEAPQALPPVTAQVLREMGVGSLPPNVSKIEEARARLPFLKKKTHTAAKNDETDEHEDHEEHPDERWLVSYADMMTLLFGLFVMLYSMANKFEQVQQQVSKTFEKENKEASQAQAPAATATPSVTPSPSTPSSPLPANHFEQLLREQLETTQKERDTLSQKIKELETDLNNQKFVSKDIQNRETEQTKELIAAKNQTLQLQKEIENLKADLKKKPVPPAPQAQVLKPNPNPELKAELRETAQELKQTQKELTQKEQVIEKLEAQIDKIKKDSGIHQKKFLALVINWSTKDHDIDLVLTDPRGAVFDFKQRRVEGSPGVLALDTRRGPGTEVWQTDEILPGTYTATITLYNQYGNPEPAQVTGTLFSASGSLSLPAMKLDFKKTKTITVKFTTNQNGSVSLAK